MVLHFLQEDLDCFLAVVALVLRPVQVIRLVDEQHAAHRALERFACFRRRVSYVLSDEIIPGHRDQMTLAHVSEPVQDLGHAHRHRGLARAGIAREAHVERRRRGAQTDLPAQSVHEQESADVAYAALYGRKTDELAIESLEHPSDLRIAKRRIEIQLPPRFVLLNMFTCRAHVPRSSVIPASCDS